MDLLPRSSTQATLKRRSRSAHASYQLETEGQIRAYWIIEELRIRALLALGRFAEFRRGRRSARCRGMLGWQSLAWRLRASRAAALDGLGDEQQATERRTAVDLLMAVAAP